MIPIWKSRDQEEIKKKVLSSLSRELNLGLSGCSRCCNLLDYDNVSTLSKIYLYNNILIYNIYIRVAVIFQSEKY